MGEREDVGRLTGDIENIADIASADRVVGVRKDDVFTTRRFKPRVSCVGKSAVRFVDRAHKAVFFRIFVADFAAAVGRAVVDEDYLIVRKRFVDNAVEAVFEMFFNPVDGNYHA